MTDIRRAWYSLYFGLSIAQTRYTGGDLSKVAFWAVVKNAITNTDFNDQQLPEAAERVNDD